jgi:ornithine lipid ester-linked acyl 2-hydroxylase
MAASSSDWKKLVPLTYLLRAAVKQKSLEMLAIHRCPVGTTPFFENDLFPWVPTLEGAAEDIIAEYKQMERAIERIPAIHELSPEQKFISKDDNWKFFVLKTYDGTSSTLATELCPKTMHALNGIPGVRVAFFSILEPGKKLPAHRGPYAGILRCHLGVQIPEERTKCRIRVDEEWRHWEKGKVLVFDDSYEHEVDNATNERRVVLFIDFVRPLRAPFNIINDMILTRFLDRAKFATNLEERQLAWEATVREAWRLASASSLDDIRAAAE